MNSGTTAAAPQCHRRIFRGRGGANDRRLPKHNAALKHRPTTPTTTDDINGSSSHESQQQPKVIIDSNTGTILVRHLFRQRNATTRSWDPETGNLQSRRRRQQQQQQEEGPTTLPLDGDDELFQLQIIHDEDNNINNNNNDSLLSTHLVPSSPDQDICTTTGSATTSDERDSSRRAASEQQQQPHTSTIASTGAVAAVATAAAVIAPKVQQELGHLLRRIRNNRTSMSLSTTAALSNLTNYQTNVLAACTNTVREWRSILRQYDQDPSAATTVLSTQFKEANSGTNDSGCPTCKTTNGSTLDSAVKTSTGLAIFEMIQQSLQCGPLAGSKSGYFKRCGSEPAAMVHQYLTTLLSFVDRSDNETKQQQPNGTNGTVAIAETLGWSAAQIRAIQKWACAAEKAAAKEQAPSSSMLKNRETAKKKK